MTAMSIDDESPFGGFSTSTCMGSAVTSDSELFLPASISMEATSFVVMDDTVGTLAIEGAGGRVDFASLWESSAMDSVDVVDVVELPITFERGALLDKALEVDSASSWESSATELADVVDVVELPIALLDRALASKGVGGEVDFPSSWESLATDSVDAVAVVELPIEFEGASLDEAV